MTIASGRTSLAPRDSSLSVYNQTLMLKDQRGEAPINRVKPFELLYGLRNSPWKFFVLRCRVKGDVIPLVLLKTPLRNQDTS